MKLINIDLSRLRNGEYIGYLSQTIEVLKYHDPDILNLREYYESLIIAHQGTCRLFKKATGNPITKDIQKADMRRDRVIYGIKSLLKGHSYSEMKEQAQHANRLLKYLSRNGKKITTDNYPAKTSLIRKMLGNFSSQELLRNAIEALQLNTWLENLEAANHEFEKAFMARVRNLAETNGENFKTKRNQANDACYQLRNVINAQLIISKNDTRYINLARNLNAMIKRFKRL